MLIIKQLSKDMQCNIREAEDKIRRAYELKEMYPAAAAWMKEMAAAHLAFNVKGHEVAAKAIADYKSGDEYKAHPEYADGMMAVWTDRHAEIMAEGARVKAMVDMFK